METYYKGSVAYDYGECDKIEKLFYLIAPDLGFYEDSGRGLFYLSCGTIFKHVKIR